MIDLVIKQRIILAHIDGMSNRAIANLLHLSKDTVNKYVNEYNEKREELLRMHPDMDSKRQTIRLTLNQRRFISGAVFCIRLEVLQPKASSDPDQQDLYFPVHHKVLAAP